MRRLGLCSLALVTLLGVLSYVPCTHSLAVMSLDLGSEWLKIAIVKPGVPMEIVLNKESRRKTPVVIALRDGDLQVGDPAMSTATRYPKSAYFYLQDLLAKSIDSPLVKTFQKRFPFYELLKDEERNTVMFKHDDELNYSPEELLAIILGKARDTAQDFAEQPIKDVVMTVPVFFNQAERKSIMYAAELAGLKVLQLMNSNTAVALNYGVFRRADFDTTPLNIMFYDLGAGSAIATIVTYQVAKTKEKGVSETNPQLSIKGVGLKTETLVETVPFTSKTGKKYERNPELEIRGVGFDRTLGGLEMEMRLRDHLADLFTKQKKTPNSVYDSPRSMAKLLKEAKRVKKVLSANVDHFSQIEGLLDDKDFKASKVSRVDLEEMNADLFERIEAPIKDALKMSEMSMSEIDQVILYGGSSRIPKVQDVLLKVTGKKELGKNINADEAAALGAVYQAAHLGKGFKVKKFVIKDANLFPIQVSFQRTVFGEDGEEDSVKTVKRTLFGRGNPYPQKKVMTFNRHTDDFDFNVAYNDIEELLSGDMLESFGSANLTSYSVEGVAAALKKNSEAESKGIKAHFRMDDSGILHLDSVESVFEKTEQVMEEVNDTDGQSTFAKLSSTISNFFSGSAGEEGEEDAVKTETASDDENPPPAEGAEEEKPKGDDEPAATEEKPDEGDEKAAETEDKPAETDEKEPEAEEADKEVDKKAEDEQQEQKDEVKETEEKPATEEDVETEDKPAEDDKKDETADETKKEEDTEDTKKEGDTEDTKKEETSDDTKKDEASDDAKTDETVDDSKKSNETDGEGKDSKKKKKEKKKVAKPKVVTIKENITVNADVKDMPSASKESRKASKNKLKELKKKEEAKIEKEKALNKLESFIYETQEKLYEEVYEECSVEEERDSIRTSLTEASDWLYEQPDDAEAAVYKDKLKELKKVFKDLHFRVKEMKERPEIEKAIKDVLNYTHHFVGAATNMSEEDQIFTEKELSTLIGVYNDTLSWFRTKSTKQEETPCTHYPAMLTADMKEKYLKLDREVQYLYNKAKSTPKKKKPKKDSKKDKKKSSNTTETAEEAANGDGVEVEVENGEEGKEKPETEETVEAPPTDEKAPTEETATETQEEAPSEDKKEGGEEEKKEETKEEEPEVLQLGAEGIEIPPEETKTQEDENKNSAKDSQSETSKKQTDQSKDTKDHNQEPNAHNTGEL